MRVWLLASVLVLCVSAAAPSAIAQDAAPGNMRAGRQLALRDCAVCHIVAVNQETRPLVPRYAPSFFDVANKPDVTAASLEAFLARQHPLSNMPNPGLTDAQIKDVAGYILSLRGEH